MSDPTNTQSQCQDCGEPTLFPGICIDCTDKRIENYPKVKKELEKIKLKPTDFNNLNETTEAFKSLAYCFKDEARELKQSNIKLLRVLRDHEKRLVALEQEIGTIKERMK